MSMNKKQVKAILDMTNPKKPQMKGRMALTTMWVKEDKAYATDGYILVEMNIGDSGYTDYTPLDRDELEKWYKLASTKDILNVKDIPKSDMDAMYPDVQELLNEEKEANELCMNNDFIKSATDMLGDKYVIITMEESRMRMRNDNGQAIIMSSKKR